MVLSVNFPGHHTLWDLHHYFHVNGDEFDAQFDLSLFLNWHIPFTLSSYRAAEYGNRIPDLVINILSKSTWRADLSENLEMCQILRIPVYIVFCPFAVASNIYHPPFLRAYFYSPQEGNLTYKDLRKTCIRRDGTVDLKATIHLGETIPFLIGLIRLEKEHEGHKSLYRMVLVDPQTGALLQSTIEKEKARADAEKTRADMEKTRADRYQALLQEHNIDLSE